MSDADSELLVTRQILREVLSVLRRGRSHLRSMVGKGLVEGWDKEAGGAIARATELLQRPDPEASASPAEVVLGMLDTGEWLLVRNPGLSYLTDEANAANRWTVSRSASPYGDSDGNRQWNGPTAYDAMMTAHNAMKTNQRYKRTIHRG